VFSFLLFHFNLILSVCFYCRQRFTLGKFSYREEIIDVFFDFNQVDMGGKSVVFYQFTFHQSAYMYRTRNFGGGSFLDVKVSFQILFWGFFPI